MEIIRDYDHILQAIVFFDQYASFVLTLRKSGQYCLLLDNVNHYFEEVVAPSYSGPLYDLYFYSGALLNAFVMWEERNTGRIGSYYVQVDEKYLNKY